MRAVHFLLASLGVLGRLQATEPTLLPMQVMMSDQGRTITLKPGQMLEVVLDANHTTGYSWSLKKIDATVVTIQGEPVYRTSDAKPGMTGVGGREAWHFQAVAPGQQGLDFTYRRPFEPKAPPARTFSIIVRVQP